MKILIVADREESYIWDFFDKERFKDVDLIISCGDLKAEYLSFLVTMINAPLYYVPGNHDTDYTEHPPEGCVSIDGAMEIYKGVKIAGLGGSPFYCESACQYTEKQMKKRVRKLRHIIRKNGGLDILVAHSPAFGINDGEDICHKGFISFIELMDEYSPRYFFHGHQHQNYGSNNHRTVRFKNTIIVNAFGYHIIEY